MAPIGFIASLSNSLYPKQQVVPVISEQSAALLSIALTVFYVAPFYLSPSTRPSPTLSRDAPSVIRARVRMVTLSCVISMLFVSWLIVKGNNTSLSEALKLLGVWPIGIFDIAQSFLLTAVLFTGPLFERGIAEGEWREWIRGGRISESLSGWIGWRNYVAGPVTEEAIFRAAIIPLHLLAQVSPGRIVFIAPLYFGIAHVHHFYEFRLTHADTSVLASLLRSIFQFGYTTVFGWYATFLYLRTGSLWAVILVHSFCNWCGLPRLWGRVEAGYLTYPPVVRGKKDTDINPGHTAPGKLGLVWTVAYYTLLVAGAIGFYHQLWPLTESIHALASFTSHAA
ncbi:hypothetical protein ASPZODRAFT_862275 [Penicilliopsis zonata CBS 506.65]|uniref:intramembrane prenyl-peptidase Rce1 n=1 Tax=Penicilliopsis zonata CBS 506.65 TaxID=1073090 RepID=A0A1L9S9B1_9EURO|nr:hypothetical protein ASPZODRAFT_862275 [Penicilliopsis zonata CBS 506.65]OJJ43744.1 hypothetical protein ASPZODRAFT_862275 [Penicilliopsis zonata CBS 506.65]